MSPKTPLQFLSLLALASLSSAQQPGAPESRPLLTTHYCTKSAGCTPQNTSVVLDAATHNIHSIDNPNEPCVTSSGTLDPTLCPDKETCAANCIIEGITDYASYGVETSGLDLTLTMYADTGNGELSSLSPRVYLVSEDTFNINATVPAANGTSNEVDYTALRLLNQEFTFTVDTTLLPCGMNGALYLSEMAPSGGQSDLNPAGAAYGTGYCDAQCYVTPWINGEGNVNDNGACCNEMDIWEANGRSMGFTPHGCVYPEGSDPADGLYECTSEDECDSTGENDGVCDKWGCGFNPYALGREEYYGTGAGFELDSRSPFTVVTQFVTDDGTDTGTLIEIRRLYIQDGAIIENAVVTVGGAQEDSLTDTLCASTSSWFSGSFGGLEVMGNALGRGMVLAMSIWNDAGGYMQWLDGLAEGAGPCNATEGAPEVIEQTVPGTRVVFSDLRWGDIGTTYSV